MNSIINRIPETQLGQWYWLLAFLAIVLATLAALLSFAAFKVNGQILSRKADAEAEFKSSRTNLETELAASKAEAAAAQQAASEARARIQALEEKAKWRRIAPEQRQKFLDATREAPKGPVVLTCLRDDLEARSFAERLNHLFKEAGYQTQEIQEQFRDLSAKPALGVALRVASKELIPPHTGALQAALKQIGVEALAQLGGKEDIVTVEIGQAP